MSSANNTSFLWTAALSSGLIAGVYLAFSGFVMQVLDKINPTQAITAMASINKTILRFPGLCRLFSDRQLFLYF